MLCRFDQQRDVRPRHNSVKSVASVNHVAKGHSSLLQMKQRHNACIAMLQDKLSSSQEEEDIDSHAR